MKSKVRVGIAGLGRISTATHLPILRSFENVEIVAGADTDLGRRDRIKSLFNLKYVFEDFNKMFEIASEMDAVYVCLPPSLHFTAVMKALNMGLHVFCEKPMGISSRESLKMIEEAEQKNLILLPGYKWRFNTNLLRAKELVERGKIGKIVQVQATFMTPGPYISWDPKSEWYFDEFGALYDTGCHIINIMQHIIPNKFRIVSAHAINGHLGYETPTNVCCSFILESDVVGTLDIGWRGSVDTLALSIHGTAGMVNVTPKVFQHFGLGVDPGDRIINHLSNCKEEIGRTMCRIVNKFKSKDFSPEDVAINKYFIQVIQEGNQPTVSGKDAMATTTVLEAIKRSIDSGGGKSVMVDMEGI